MKCINGFCDKKKKYISLDENNSYILGEDNIGKLNLLLSYFLYKAPNIDSHHSPYIEADTHDSVFLDMMSSNWTYSFCPQNKKIETELEDMGLSGNSVCQKCKRFLCKRSTQNCKRDKSRKETELECLLRHIRNSIAHGHVFVTKAGNYINVLLEDINPKNDNITARLVCRQSDLVNWKKILQKAIK